MPPNRRISGSARMTSRRRILESGNPQDDAVSLSTSRTLRNFAGRPFFAAMHANTGAFDGTFSKCAYNQPGSFLLGVSKIANMLSGRIHTRATIGLGAKASV